MESVDYAFHGALNLLTTGLFIPLGVLLIGGLILAVFQSATQIQEQLLTFFPKVVMGFVFIYMGGKYFVGEMVDYLESMMNVISLVR
ncbi:MAG TPA: flagellar biosynthetic protein FliQ [Oligoflexia bacterium]|nr:flagellar biosynthetic protein FliQ [Oligoflexia bacterium]HMP49690.1 flagellar biosynthetic protein FliQ [Oligoflexia bacterium]